MSIDDRCKDDDVKVGWLGMVGLPDVLGMSRVFTLRNAQTIENLGFDMQFNAKTPMPLAQLSYPPVG